GMAQFRVYGNWRLGRGRAKSQGAVTLG
ncbi:MAG: hypothetical protein ACI9KS_001825, partial [Sulfitobacter sp.]